jgi:hypothetical protein
MLATQRDIDCFRLSAARRQPQAHSARPYLHIGSSESRSSSTISKAWYIRAAVNPWRIPRRAGLCLFTIANCSLGRLRVGIAQPIGCHREDRTPIRYSGCCTDNKTVFKFGDYYVYYRTPQSSVVRLKPPESNSVFQADSRLFNTD